MLLDYQSGPSSTAAARGLRLAGMAALAYILVIIYASLQPFADWRALSGDFGAFLFESWPRWITVDDILFNFAAYVPLGFLLALALSARRSRYGAAIEATIICAGLSLLLEAVQQYLPSRIASNVDLLVNSFGGTAGALVAPLFTPGQRLGRAAEQLRDRLFVRGAPGDAALILAGLWLITQLHAPLIVFGNGDLRGMLNLTALFTHTPVSYFAAEAGVVTLNVLGLGLLLAGAVHRTGAGYWRALALIFASAAALKTMVVLLILRAPNPWVWLTPGVITGLAAGLVLLLLLAQLPRRGRVLFALLALTGAVVLINIIPENPYRPAPPFQLLGRTSHILNVTSMTRALSDLWPFLAILAALFSLSARRSSAY